MSLTAKVMCLAFATLFPSPWDKPDVMCKYTEQVLEVSEKYNLSPYLIIAVARKESAWTVNIKKSKAGACGLMQVIPRHTKKYADRHYTCQELKDPRIALDVGAQALKYAFKFTDTGKNVKQALCIYSAGPPSKKNPTCKGWKAKKHGTSYARWVLKRKKALEDRVEDILVCLDDPQCEAEWEFPKSVDEYVGNLINEYK